MPNKNQVILTGHLARDPKINETANGVKVANITIGVSEGKKDEKTTEWIDCVLWKYAAEEVASATTGDVVTILDGKIRKRKYTDKNGVDRYPVEVHAFSAIHKTWASSKTTSNDNFDDIPF